VTGKSLSRLNGRLIQITYTYLQNSCTVNKDKEEGVEREKNETVNNIGKKCAQVRYGATEQPEYHMHFVQLQSVSASTNRHRVQQPLVWLRLEGGPVIR